MKTIRKSGFILAVAAIISCSVSEKTQTGRKHDLRIYAGQSKGGIIENTKMEEVENAVPDAFTGATYFGGNAGVHYEYNLNRSSFEAGIDAIMNNQKFTYNDAINHYYGERNIVSTQIRMPVTYNFTVLRYRELDHLMQLKLGLSPAYIMYSVNESGTSLPDYSVKHLTVGPIFGITIIPLKFRNGAQLGISFDVSRSGKVYDDFYQKGDIPGLSYRTFSILYGY
jgi:hypothetical protein